MVLKYPSTDFEENIAPSMQVCNTFSRCYLEVTM